MNEISGRIFVITGGASLIRSHLTDALPAGGGAEVRSVKNFALGSPVPIAHLTGNPTVGAASLASVFGDFDVERRPRLQLGSS